MAQRPPRRSHRDDFDDYYAPSPHDRYYGASPPQRHKSEGRSRRRSPDMAPQADAYASRRAYSRREPPEPLAMSTPAGGGRARSPPPYYASGSPFREPRRDRQFDESRRDPRRPHHARDGFRDYDHGGYQPLPNEKSRRLHRDDLVHRPRRDEAVSPVGYGRHRPRDWDEAGYRPRRSRPSSPEPRPRARTYISSPFRGEDEMPHRRARSHDRTKTREVFSPRGRDHDMPTPPSRPSHARRKSAPAPPPGSASASASAAKAALKQWWQNPNVQAGARTALSAGAQAVMQSRNDPSPWLGAKGAKVATAALGAALMDGFGGKKQPPRR
ncbi:hypothetical protein E4U42_006386 [Claviceps africana]|uniref:Uncharacterized protein n=1 Tax=Claviceps africana TaxID=83212 RepID=A0A8K0NGU3_9HYPO|nr:hypothetical protein E4U42_006386 [Claviceps africana]